MKKFVNNGVVSESNIFFDKVYKNQRQEESILQEIISQLINLQEDRFIYDKTEPEKNRELRRLLRARGLHASEEVKQGRSGTKNKENFKYGNLDIVIFDSENNQIVRSIIEAFELKYLKSETIENHIDKLLNRYDTAGNEENFVVIYSKARNFEKLWDKYKKFVDQKIFSDESNIEELELDKACIKGGKNYYTVHSKKLCLYHLFVNMKAF